MTDILILLRCAIAQVNIGHYSETETQFMQKEDMWKCVLSAQWTCHCVFKQSRFLFNKIQVVEQKSRTHTHVEIEHFPSPDQAPFLEMCDFCRAWRVINEKANLNHCNFPWLKEMGEPCIACL